MKLIKHIINVDFKAKTKAKQRKLYLIALLFFYFILFFINTSKILIEVDISKIRYEGGGPIQLQKSISKILPYETKKCKFIPIDGIYPLSSSKKKNINYFYLSFPCMRESTYNRWKLYNKTKSLILGPCFVPNRWFYFPMKKYWKERRFREILQSIKAVVVHSIRVRNHLAKKSNNNDLLNRFIILRPCTHIMPNNIIPFEERKIDILFYEKYSDLKRHKQGNQLFELLNNTDKKIEKLLCRNYTQNQEFILAENSKFVIYFSFYDTGAIALKEIQNYGVIAFSLQKDLVISDETSYYIPELEYEDMNPAFDKIMDIINHISNINPDTKKIANINQNINKCERALDDLCNGIINNK